MFWELSTAESLFIEGLRASGEWKRLRERTPRLIEECRERGDRIAEALWACACPTFIHVLDDTPDQGLRESAEGLRAWGREGTYTTVSFGHFYFVPWLHAYSGDAETAHELAEREWPAFRGSLLSRVQTLRFYAREMRGLVAVHAALAKEEGRARRLAIARGCASALEREGHPVASAVAALVRAGADAVRGDRARTVDALTELVARFETVGMHGYAHAARRHLGLHRGDARGAELVRTADQWMLGQGVKKPESVARLLAPGFTPA